MHSGGHPTDDVHRSGHHSARQRAPDGHRQYAVPVRNVVHAAGVRAHRHVHVDVHRGPVSAQCGHAERVPGHVPVSAVFGARLGRAGAADGRVVGGDGVQTVRDQVSGMGWMLCFCSGWAEPGGHSLRILYGIFLYRSIYIVIFHSSFAELLEDSFF